MNLFRRFATSVLKIPQSARPDLDQLIEFSPDGTVIVDSEGAIVIVNSETERLFGYNRQELIGQSVEILIPSRFGQLHVRHRAAFQRQPKTRAMGAGLGLVGRRKDGTEFPVDISLSHLRTAEGVFFISAVRDITERKQSEEQIKQLNAELGEALRRAEALGPGNEQAIRMAKEIEERLDTLRRLLSQLQHVAGDQARVKALADSAQEEAGHIGRITGKVMGLQYHHEQWKKR